ncbi:MAG: hypothetical protein AAB598_02275 [Patescibacteria group bacterium]
MKHIILLIIVALIFIGIIWWYQAQVSTESPTVSVMSMRSESIEAETEAIDIGDLDTGFKEIDAGISAL